ncbi:hypothetical protein HPB47_023540 [Ixodes persulcatus]|uniref:Uncharacterized protein n=1 Tax=Ixodes persulcatus TaxID=34615 RepID=A0AC60Q6M7_IXOPE|nr:hypothetical protein HPB47_023540 [Ixodes persulcatus]
MALGACTVAERHIRALRSKGMPSGPHKPGGETAAVAISGQRSGSATGERTGKRACRLRPSPRRPGSCGLEWQPRDVLLAVAVAAPQLCSAQPRGIPGQQSAAPVSLVSAAASGVNYSLGLIQHPNFSAR